MRTVPATNKCYRSTSYFDILHVDRSAKFTSYVAVISSGTAVILASLMGIQRPSSQ